LLRVILTDESTIALLDDRVQTVRQKSDEEFLPACLKKQTKCELKMEKARHPKILGKLAFKP